MINLPWFKNVQVFFKRKCGNRKLETKRRIVIAMIMDVALIATQIQPVL